MALTRALRCRFFPLPRCLLGGLGGVLCCLLLAVAVALDASVWARLDRLDPIVFWLAMALLPAVGVPMTPFYVVAGLRFGVGDGLGLGLTAVLCHLLLCYAVARGRLRGYFRDTLDRRFPGLAHLDTDRRHAWRITLLIKLVPGVPMFLKHYALGAAGVPLGVYLGVALVTTLPYAVAFVTLGEAALEGNVGRVLAVVGGLALLAAGIGLWRSRR
ncbi:TVP38/TMEM64 family protein [Salinicola aestuarinus]|uniref:TVP38/TMEM64 family protein n=1 Tax=Salinicola aestuarinus TaxID=1949082 RepID=UPI000DA220BF|nr:VTT domain-containing protein [Salinicola aestuarinus]